MFNMNNMMGNMNMNPMGMNNQTMANFAMDNTAMKIRAIIDPYEKKISELEKLIKEKDFEILVLKEKLNNYKNNQMNMNNNQMIMNNQVGMNNPMMMVNNPVNMNNNLNMINPIGMNNNINNNNWANIYNNNIINNNNNINLNLNKIPNQINPPIPNIKIIFKYNQIDYPELCNFNEKAKIVLLRFCKKVGIKFKTHKFIYNGKKIYHRLTIAELGIAENSIINVISDNSDNNSVNEDDEDTDSESECSCEGTKINVGFRTDKGLFNNIRISPNHSIGTLLKKYLAKKGEIHELNNNNVYFICNGCKLGFFDKTKINNSFMKGPNPSVIVYYTQNLIGV